MEQRFSGIEYRNENVILMKEVDVVSDSGVVEVLQLVEIDVQNATYNHNVLIDLPNSINQSIDFFSTAYNACEDIYYYTLPNENSDFATDILEIDIGNNQLKKIVNNDTFLLGLACKP